MHSHRSSQVGHLQKIVHVAVENLEMDSLKTLCVYCFLEIVSPVDTPLNLKDRAWQCLKGTPEWKLSQSPI